MRAPESERSGPSVGVIGAGAWGTAIGAVLARKGVAVELWSHEPGVAAGINAEHRNEKYLPGVALPEGLRASATLAEVVAGKDFLFLAVPSLHLLEVVKRMTGCAGVKDARVVIAVLTKGLVETTGGIRLVTDAVEDLLPGGYHGRLVYVAGPSHAIEVAQGKLTGLISASRSGRNSIRVREILSGTNLVVFSSLDVRGVQVSAALKNVVAIAFGILDALKESTSQFGDNTESLLLAAGLNEIRILGRFLGATHAETFTSIAGVGDLDVTCRSPLGRNRRFGREIITKRLIDHCASIDDVIGQLPCFGYLAEGVVTAKWVHQIAAHRKLELPIVCGVYRILNRQAEPLAEVQAMLERILSRSGAGRLPRGPSALLRGSAGWAARRAHRG
jgi:glycerol-3-phosphate dehydrogenase (NAD(P)+)